MESTLLKTTVLVLVKNDPSASELFASTSELFAASLGLGGAAGS